MNLLLDIGNTRIKWALHDAASAANDFVAFGDVAHQSNMLAAFDAVHAGVMESVTENVAGVWAVNVAGAAVRSELSLLVQKHYSLEARFVESQSASPGLSNAYADPAQLGADRWVAMIAAVALDRERVCVVDAGTAVTIDFIVRNQHLGGLILPGLALMQSSLFNSTGDIERFSRPTGEMQNLAELAGDTDAAVRHGAAQAVVGAIQFAIRQQSESAGSFNLLLTGGDARILIPLLENSAVDYRPALVLEGLAGIAGVS